MYNIKDYLKALTKYQKILRSEVMLNFLELPVDVRVMLTIKTQYDENENYHSLSSSDDWVDQFLYRVDGNNNKFTFNIIDIKRQIGQ